MRMRTPSNSGARPAAGRRIGPDGPDGTKRGRIAWPRWTAFLAFAGMACGLSAGAGEADAPTGLRTALLRGTSARLEWTAVGGAAGYTVRRDGAEAAQVTGAAFEETDRVPLTTHDYSVRARFPDGTFSAWSDALPVTFPGPRAPTNLQLWWNDGASVQIAWDEPVDQSLSTYYIIYRNGAWHDGSGSPYYNDYYIESGATYEYQVYMFWDGYYQGLETYQSPPSETLRVTVPAPPAPTMYLYFNTPTEAYLQWECDYGHYYGAEFDLYRDDDPTPVYSGWDRGFYDADRTPGTAHTYRVRTRAYSSGLVSAPSDPLTVEFRYPDPPQLYAGAVGSNYVELHWFTNVSDRAWRDFLVYRNGQHVATTGARTYRDTGRSPGESLTYEVRMRYGPNNWQTGASDAVAAVTRLAAPPSLHVRSYTGHSVTLYWTGANNTGYTPEYDIEADGVIVAVVRGGVMEWTEDNLSPGQQRAYRVRTRLFAGEESEWSNERVATTRVPRVPTLTPRAVTAQSTQWDIGYPETPSLSGYDMDFQVERNGQVVATLYEPGTWNDAGLAPGTTYAYRVRSRFYPGCESAWSEMRETATPGPVAPALRVQRRAATSLEFAWTAQANTGYTLEYDMRRDGTVVATGLRGTAWTDTGLTPGASHAYEIRSRFFAGCESAWSAPFAASTIGPLAPALRVARQGAVSLDLAWDAQADVEYTVEYDLRRDGQVVATGVRDTAWTDTGLLPAQAVSYEIRSRFYPGCESAWGAPFAASTMALAPPADFVGSALSVAEIRLSWDDDARRNSGYDAEYDLEADGVVVATVKDNAWTHTGLAPDSLHAYRIRTRFFAGAESAWSAAVAVRTRALAPPTYSVESTKGNAVLLRIAQTGSSGYPNAQFEIRRDGVAVATVGAGVWTDGGLAPGTTYRYTARTVPFAGCYSDWGAPVDAATRLPEPPDVSVVERTGYSIRLQWQDRFDTGFACEYDVERDGVTVATVTARTFNDVGLASGVEYAYRVRTRFLAGVESAWSAEVRAATVAPPVPSLSVYSHEANSVHMDWYFNDYVGYDAEFDIERDGTIIATCRATGGTPNYYFYGYNGHGYDTGLTPGTAYTYRVRTRLYPGCESAWSTPQTATTPVIYPPSIHVADRGLGRVTLYGDCQYFYMGYTGIDFEWERDGVVVATRRDHPEFTDANLAFSTAYTYRLRFSAGGLGTSPWSTAVTATTLGPEAPQPQTNLQTATSIRLYWYESYDSGFATREFDVYRDGVKVATTSDTAWLDEGLDPDTAYVYRLATRFYPGCESEPGAPATVRTKAPETPRNFQVRKIGWDRVVLGWTPMSGAGIPVTYEIHRDGAAIGTVVDGNEFVDADREAGARHVYRARAAFTATCASAFTADAEAVMPVRADGNGLRGRYYADDTFKTRIAEGREPQLNYAPIGADAPTDTFAARWEGWIVAPLDDTFTLRVETTGGVRLWLDGQRVMDHWSHAGSINAAAAAAMKTGRRVAFRLEWRAGARDRAMRLSWEGTRFPAETVPSSQLFPAALIGPNGLGAVTDGAGRLNPAWVEGEAPEGTVEVHFSVDGGAWKEARLFQGRQWYLDDASATAGLPLGVRLAAGASSTVRLQAVDASGAVTESECALEWTPTVLDGASAAADPVYARVGDSLLWVVGDETTPAGTAAAVRSHLVGDVAAAPGVPVAVRYDTPGEYTVRGLLGGVEVGAVALVVVEIPFEGNPVPFGMDEIRSRHIRVRPVSAVPALQISVNHETLVEPMGHGQSGQGMEVQLRTRNYVGQGRMFVRLGGPDGPIVAERSLQVVSVWLVSGGSLPVIHRYPDGSQLIGATVEMKPCLPDIPLLLHGLSGEMLFDGVGLSTRNVFGRDFDVNGQFNYCILARSGTCHGVTVADRED